MKDGPDVTRLNLWFRSLLVCAIPLGIACAVVGHSLLTSKSRELNDHFVRFLNSGTVVLERQAVRAISDEATIPLAESAEDLLKRIGATSVVVLDGSGDVVVSTAVPGRRDLEGDTMERLASLALSGKKQSSYTYTMDGEVLLYTSPLTDAAKHKVGGLAVLVPRSTVEAELAPYRLRTIGSLLLLLVGLTLVTAWGFMALVIGPLRRFDTMRVKRVAEGGSSGRSASETEKTVQHVVERTQQLRVQLTEHADKLLRHVRALSASLVEVRSMSEEVSATVQQISKGAEEQVGKVSDVHHLLQDMVKTMKDVEYRAGDTASTVEKAADGARQGGELANQSMDRMSALNNAIRKSSEVMNRLGTQSQQIGRVVEIISAIAEQTNLLSLNAAIEAARAGEQGRGFAVVAEEIRKLADESTKATAGITEFIQQIQEETQNAIVAMEDGSHEAEESRHTIMVMRNTLEEIILVVENAAKSSRNIQGFMENSKKQADQVVQSVQEINAVSEEYAASTEEISASTQEHASTLEQMTATVRELTTMSAELKDTLEKFKTS